MLAMVQIHHIKKMHRKKGLSLRELARSTGHDFRTVQKYVNQDDFSIKIAETRGRPSKMDPFREIIVSWLKEDLKYSPKQRHTAKRIYERLLEKYPKFNASSRTVRAFVAKLKTELYEPKDTYLPLKHPQGEAQADFGEAEFIEKGKEIKGYYLNLSFPYSNASYVQVFRGQNQECLLTGLQQIFERMGRVPTHIWFDNLSSAVVSIREKGQRVLTDAFQRFQLHYGFESNFCNPNSGHEKGHVENKVGYNRRNFFVPVPTFESLAEFNTRLFAMAEKDWQRDHYQKKQRIDRLFEDELKSMLPLPHKPFDVFRLVKAKATKTGKIQFETNLYSTAPEFARHEVWLKVTAKEIIILDPDYKEIIRHARIYGKHQEAMNWYPYLNVLAKRPTAIKYTEFFNQLPNPWQEYLNQCNYDQKKTSLQALIKMITETSMEIATTALEECLEKEIYDPDSILVNFYRLTQPSLQNELKLPEHIPSLQSYELNLASYDELLLGGKQP